MDMWMDLLSHGGPALPCRWDCQVLIIYQFDILMLVFVRTPSKFVSLQEGFFFGLGGCIGKDISASRLVNLQRILPY
jgi:hypothetical protein